MIQVQVGTDLHDITDNKITLLNADITGADLTAFNANKKIIIQKILNSEVKQSLTISIENLDITPPSLASTSEVESYDNFNTIKLTGLSDTGGSGLKELRYEYATKLEGEDEVPYYTSMQEEINQEYLLNLGKKTDIGLIKLPKDVKSIVVIAVDNAGNASTPEEFDI